VISSRKKLVDVAELFDPGFPRSFDNAAFGGRPTGKLAITSRRTSG